MAKYQLLLPKMGESVAEATIIRWLKSPGDMIEADEAIMEIATDKVDSEVPSPVSGKLVEQLCNENDVVQVGAVIAVIEVGVSAADRPAPTAPRVAPAPVASSYKESYPENDTVEFEEREIPGINQLKQTAPAPRPQAAPAFVASDRFYSPLVKNIATHEGISNAELDKIPGTGADGRLTKDDLLHYIAKRPATQANRAPAAAPQPVAAPRLAPQPTQPQQAPRPQPQA